MDRNDQHPLLPAYLAMGSDDLKREVVVKRLRQRIAREGNLDFNSETFDGATASGEAIVVACNTLPFASPVRLVQVDDCDRLSTADREPIVAYLESPSPTTVLCLVSPSLQKNSRLYKAVAALGKSAVIDCALPKRKDLPAQVRAMATGKGITLTPAAAEALVDRVGENTVALEAQLGKLALAHTGSDAVNESEVVAQVAATAERKPWDFTDAFSQRNVQKCLYIRSRLGGTSPFALLGMCVTRVRELMIARSLAERGRQADLASVLHQPSWRVRNHMMWARGFTADELHRALVSARDAEMAMKSGADPEGAFQAWWLQAIARR